jgi:hypothetical protein
MKRFSMKKSTPAILAAAVAAIFAAEAKASISLQVTPVPLTGTDGTALTANGWEALKLTFVADGTQSGGVVAWDFAEAVTGLTSTSVLPIGISGPIYQTWDDSTTPTPLSTKTNHGTVGSTTNPPGSLPQPSAGSSITDSFFAVYPSGYSESDGTGANEDNNLVVNTSANNLVTGNYGFSPIQDVSDDGSNGNGVGSTMTWAGAIKPNSASTSSTVLKTAPISLDWAYVIVPINANGKNNVTIYGTVGDDKNSTFVIDQVLNPGAVSTTTPEPASVGLVAVGVMGLLARRRNKR